MSFDSDVYSLCPKCGSVYLNFCVKCAKQFREELVESLLDKYGLTVENLVKALAGFVNREEPNLKAIQLAIDLKSMKPPIRADLTTGGQPLIVDHEQRDRLLKKLKPESS